MPDLTSEAFAKTSPKMLTHPAEAVGVLLEMVPVLSLLDGAFGDHDEAVWLMALIASFEMFSDDLEVVGDFRDENHIGTPGQSTVKGDPSGVATHHLDDKDPMMCLSGVSQTGQTVSDKREAAGRLELFQRIAGVSHRPVGDGYHVSRFQPLSLGHGNSVNGGQCLTRHVHHLVEAAGIFRNRGLIITHAITRDDNIVL
jgi:hypothetical protein